MTQDSPARIPLPLRALLAIAGRLAPPRHRVAWRANWGGGLESLCTLIDRGEIALHGHAHVAHFFYDAFVSAFWLRFNRDRLRQQVRGPAFVVAAALAVLLLMAAVTRGFSNTRSLAALAANVRAFPLVNVRYDPRGDRLFTYFAPIVLAWTTALTLLTIGRFTFARHGFKYWAFLLGKTVLVLVILALVWIEGGPWVRAAIPHRGLSIFFGGLVFALAFVVMTGRTVLWSLADQRRRCPVCLRLLQSPVTFGSWASVFEPVTTEMLCSDGHGTLSLGESEVSGDRWVALDESWQELFETKIAAK